MRTNYLLLLMGVGLISGLCFPQNVFVTNNAPIKVESNTLVYFGQNFEMNSAAQNGTTPVVTNAGHIKIEGTFANPSTTGNNFLNTWTNDGEYGQLIINDVNQANGMISMEKGTINSTANTWGQFAVPFTYTDANEAMMNLFGTAYVNGSDRYHASMMIWDNYQKPEYDHLNSGSLMNPYDYVILNLAYNSAGIKPLMDGNTKLTYRGNPSNGVYYVPAVNSAMFFPGQPWANWENLINSHNEKYKTYIDDPFLPKTNPDFGKYIYQFGNPYTSNLNLAYIGINGGTTEDNVYFSNLRGVAKQTGATWAYGTGLLLSGFKKATYNSGSNQWAGDHEAVIIKPFEPFMISLTTDAVNAPNFMTFGDGLKTFAMDTGADVDWTPFGRQSEGADSDQQTAGEEGGNSAPFYQVRLKLYSQDGQYTGNRVIIVTSDQVENEVPNTFEAEYFDFAGTGFYLAQERADGGHVTASQRKMDINAVNIDFVGKPIPMLFERPEGDNQSYVLKAELYQGSIFNQLDEDGENFDDGNTFFIYDNDTDELVEITNGAEFQIDPIPANGQKNRYEVYWNEGPSGKQMGTDDQYASGTVIFKDKDSHFVRFNDKWNTADVKVYDLSGRMILSYEDVDTGSNLEIKLPSRGVYAVKINSDTGEVYTQKIIK